MEQITFVELLITGGIPVGGILAAWINLRITVGGLKQHIHFLEKQLDDEKTSNKENYTAIRADIKSIFKILTDIKVNIGK